MGKSTRRKHTAEFIKNTALKPFAFRYLINKYNPQFIHYLDLDTCTYANLSVIENDMKGSSVLLSPHSLGPLPFDSKMPTDNTFLNYGI